MRRGGAALHPPARTSRGIRACRDAAIAAFGPHDLRHRYITRLVLAGVPLPLVRQVVGHARASVTLDTYSQAMLNEPGDDLDALRRSAVALYEPAPRRSRGYTGGYTAPSPRR